MRGNKRIRKKYPGRLMYECFAIGFNYNRRAIIDEIRAAKRENRPIKTRPGFIRSEIHRAMIGYHASKVMGWRYKQELPLLPPHGLQHFVRIMTPDRPKPEDLIRRVTK